MTTPREKGESLNGFRRVVTQERVTAYAHASGDHNPIHLDADFASTTRFGQRIAHGMLSLAFVWEMIAANYPTAWHRGATVKTRFTSPVIPGEEVEVSGSVKRIRTVDEPRNRRMRSFRYPSQWREGIKRFGISAARLNGSKPASFRRKPESMEQTARRNPFPLAA